MVEQIERIGKLLELPGLEDETRRMINKTMRDMLNILANPVVSLPVIEPPTESPEQQELNPFEKVQQQAKQALGADVYNEWVHGPKEGE